MWPPSLLVDIGASPSSPVVANRSGNVKNRVPVRMTTRHVIQVLVAYQYADWRDVLSTRNACVVFPNYSLSI
jgi:hypothetical protein